jgi:hypothetical protein
VHRVERCHQILFCKLCEEMKLGARWLYNLVNKILDNCFLSLSEIRKKTEDFIHMPRIELGPHPWQGRVIPLYYMCSGYTCQLIIYKNHLAPAFPQIQSQSNFDKRDFFRRDFVSKRDVRACFLKHHTNLQR